MENTMSSIREYARDQMDLSVVQKFGFNDVDNLSKLDSDFLSRRYRYKRDDEIDMVQIVMDSKASTMSNIQLAFKYGLSTLVISDIIQGRETNGFLPNKRYSSSEFEKKAKKTVKCINNDIKDEYFKKIYDNSPGFVKGSEVASVLKAISGSMGGSINDIEGSYISYSAIVELSGKAVASAISGGDEFPKVARRIKGERVKDNEYSRHGFSKFLKFHEEYQIVRKKDFLSGVDTDMLPYISKKLLPEGSLVSSKKGTWYLKTADKDIVSAVLNKHKE